MIAAQKLPTERSKRIRAISRFIKYLMVVKGWSPTYLGKASGWDETNMPQVNTSETYQGREDALLRAIGAINGTNAIN